MQQGRVAAVKLRQLDKQGTTGELHSRDDSNALLIVQDAPIPRAVEAGCPYPPARDR